MYLNGLGMFRSTHLLLEMQSIQHNCLFLKQSAATSSKRCGHSGDFLKVRFPIEPGRVLR